MQNKQYTLQDQLNWIHSLKDENTLKGIKGYFHIYEDAFWIRISESLEDDFKEFFALMGDDEGSLVNQFVLDEPPTSFSLIDYSALFFSWLKKNAHPHLKAAERDWAKIQSFYHTYLVANEGVETDFSKLQHLSSQQLEQVSLVLHPSIQVLANQKRVFWNNGTSHEKTFSELEWEVIVSILNARPMIQITEQSKMLGKIFEWTQLGLISGWRINKL